MSRTDKTNPFWVKLAHGDLKAIEAHDHTDGRCDLRPRIDRRWTTDVGRHKCRYTFHFTGTTTCCCPLCHAWEYPDRSERQRRRRERRKERSELRRDWRNYDLAR